ncbi:hypothetical protein MRX96_024650 [Rhipicephalus microplus]
MEFGGRTDARGCVHKRRRQTALYTELSRQLFDAPTAVCLAAIFLLFETSLETTHIKRSQAVLSDAVYDQTKRDHFANGTLAATIRVVRVNRGDRKHNDGNGVISVGETCAGAGTENLSSKLAGEDDSSEAFHMLEHARDLWPLHFFVWPQEP